MGFQIDFYCDNGKKADIEIRDGVKTTSLEDLYSLKDNVLVFITVASKYQASIKSQLEENGIHNVVQIDFFFLQTFLESLVELDNQELNKQFACVLDDREFLCRKFKYHLGYCPDLDNPQTFNEKIQWLKLYDRKPEYRQMVDKYEVKQYIADKIGGEYVIPTIGIYDTFDEIDFDKLPEQFVLKCTHDSNSVVICKDKSQFNVAEVGRRFDRYIKENYYWKGREWQYKYIKPRIIVEEYLEDTQDGELRDYKLFCFHGVVKALLIATGRMSSKDEVRTDFFDAELNHIDVRSGHPNSKILPHMPVNYGKMKEIAETLSAGIPHIRVDFYEVNGKLYIGELTFYHQGGMVALEPEERDREWGEWIHLDSVLKGKEMAFDCQGTPGIAGGAS